MLAQFQKYSPFSTQTITCDFDRPPQLKNATGKECGDVFDMTIPRHGDLVRNMYLKFGLTPPTEITGLTQAFVPSIYMFERFELIVGGEVVDTLYPEFINIYYNVFQDFSKKKANVVNLGPFHNNRDTDAILPDDADRIYSNTNRTFVVGLPFYFTLRDYQAFPLCALTRQEVVVRVYMKGLQDIVQLPPGVSSSSYVSSLEAVEFTHIHMDIEYVYLGQEEFKWFLNNPLTYMFTQTQQQIFLIDEGEATTNLKKKFYMDEISGPVAEIFMYVLKDANYQKNAVDKHDQFSTIGGHTVKNMCLILDEHTLVDPDSADYVFMSQLSYLLHHSGVFENNQQTNNMFVYNYSFSDNPEETCPRGTVNFSVVRNRQLILEMADVSARTKQYLYVLARSVNGLRIENGVATLLFKNV